MIDLQIETTHDGRKFFEVTSGIIYCDPKYCEICEDGASHHWDDRDAPGFSDDRLTYTAPDGSVWHGAEYMREGSSYFGWSESRYRFWKQDQADSLLNLIEEFTGYKAQWVSRKRKWIRFSCPAWNDLIFRVWRYEVEWDTPPATNVLPKWEFPYTSGAVCSYREPGSNSRTAYFLGVKHIHPEEVEKVRRQVEDRLRKDERLMLRLAADLSII